MGGLDMLAELTEAAVMEKKHGSIFLCCKER